MGQGGVEVEDLLPINRKGVMISESAVSRGTSPPQVVRAGIQDNQLHPVKTLIFVKFIEQL